MEIVLFKIWTPVTKSTFIGDSRYTTIASIM